MTNLEKIRAALDAAIAYPNSTHAELKAQDALAALAELERAAKEPVAWQWLTTGHFRRYLPVAADEPEWRPLYTAPPPAPVAEMREAVEVTDEMAENVQRRYFMESDPATAAGLGRQMIAAVRAVMGPKEG